MPWPTNSRTTLNPSDSTASCTAAEMSPTLRPGLACSMPASRARSAARMRRWTRSGHFPTATLKAASP